MAKGKIVWLNFFSTKKKKSPKEDIHICKLSSKDIRILAEMDEENEGLGVTLFISENDKYGESIRKDGKLVKNDDGEVMKDKGMLRGQAVPTEEYEPKNKKKKKDDEEEDSPPAKKKKARDEEEEDPPRKSRRRRDEEEE